MALEAFSCNDLSSFIIFETISATNHHSHEYSQHTSSFRLENNNNHTLNETQATGFNGERHSELLGLHSDHSVISRCFDTSDVVDHQKPMQGRKKRRRRQKVCASKEEAEAQRMTHIVVERNRRKQMNEHLSALRSLMPESCVQRGDQASIVAGAIDYVKELEQLLQSLEAQKCVLQQQEVRDDKANKAIEPPFKQFFMYPQYVRCQFPSELENVSETGPSIADIEVTLIETHASLRVLTSRRPRQLVKMVSGFQSIGLTILHLNVTTLDSLVLYSISAKVVEGCHLNSVEEIAGVVHQMLTVIADEDAF